MTHPKNGVKKIKNKKKQLPITQATAQSLLHLVKNEISAHETNINVLNAMIGDYWEVCDPTNTETLSYFKTLNSAKNNKRALAKRVNQLAKISKQLKDYCAST